MSFDSFVFWPFLAAVVLLYWRLPHRAQNVLLLAASYAFYAYWDWRYLGLLGASTVVDYVVGARLARTKDLRQRRLLLAVSIATSLTLLGFFKYYNFFVSEMADLLRAIGFEPHLPVLAVVLPVGISFYTFQTMSYTIDIYRGATKPAASLVDFALFLAYFPRLVAGPIERASKLLPQITAPRLYRQGDFTEGLYHVLIGMFKKIVVADNLAVIADAVFSKPAAALSGPEVLIGTYAFAFQVYGDFSGYSSIAQGVSKWLGIELSYNFQMPYFSRSPSEFWQRWHITLSQWLRDYLFTPLGANRRGRWRGSLNLVLTMLLGGLWHGAAWTYVLWGLWHGLLLVAYRPSVPAGLTQTARQATTALTQAILMFHLVCVGWILFRAESFDRAIELFAALGRGVVPTDYTWYAATMLGFLVVPLMTFEWRVYRSGDMLWLLTRPGWQRGLVYGYCVGMLLIFPPLAHQVFIYFQF